MLGFLILLDFVVGTLTIECPSNKTLASGEYYYVKSPGYPWRYTSYPECYWEITAPENHQLLLTFYDFQLSYNTDEFLEIDDGENTTVLNGYNYPDSVRSIGSWMSFLLTTNAARYQRGFDGSIKAIAEDDPCIFVCNGGKCLKENDVCDGVDDCNYGEDENYCRYSLSWSYFIGTDFPEYGDSDFFYWYYEGTEAPDCSLVKMFQPNEFQTFTSFNYPENYDNNLKCYWSFTAPSNYRVLITFYDFNIESYYDFVGLSDGKSNIVTTELTGSTNPGSFRSTGIVFWLRFITDNSVTRSGFSGAVKAVHKDDLCTFVCNDGRCLEQTDICNGVEDCVGGQDELYCSTNYATNSYEENELTDCKSVVERLENGEHIQIQSLNFPHQYVNNLDCHWILMAEVNQELVITFYDFELESGYDYLIIGEEYGDSDRIETLSGTKHLASFRSIGNVLWLRFITDNIVARNGFKANVISVTKDDLCQFVCQGGQCIEDSMMCNGVNDCGLSEDEIGCPEYSFTDDDTFSDSETSKIKVDVKTLKESEHELMKSPNYPKYDNNLDYYWVFLAPIHHSLVITLFDLELESETDYLKIGNRGSDEIAKLSGSEYLGSSFRSTENLLWLSLTTNSEETRRGFIVVVKSIPDDDSCTFVCRNGLCLDQSKICNNVDDCSSGEDEEYCSSHEYMKECAPVNLALESGGVQLVESVSYPNNYANNLDCYWDFTAPEKHYLLITFYDFKMESCCDFLMLHVGESSVKKLTGSTNPGSFRSTGNRMWIRFTSDEIVTGRGFNAYVKAFPENYDCAFVCRVGSCVQKYAEVCDGKNDCFSGEDEDVCPKPEMSTTNTGDNGEDSKLAIPLAIVSALVILLIAVILFILYRGNKLSCNDKQTYVNAQNMPMYQIPEKMETQPEIYETPDLPKIRSKLPEPPTNENQGFTSDNEEYLQIAEPNRYIRNDDVYVN